MRTVKVQSLHITSEPYILMAFSIITNSTKGNIKKKPNNIEVDRKISEIAYFVNVDVKKKSRGKLIKTH